MRDAVERVVLSGHEGKSGAGLERVRLADGRLLVVKRVESRTDFTIEVTGGLPTQSSTRTRPSVSGSVPISTGGSDDPGPPLELGVS